jgi:hypothetical protein
MTMQFDYLPGEAPLGMPGGIDLFPPIRKRPASWGNAPSTKRAKPNDRKRHASLGTAPSAKRARPISDIAQIVGAGSRKRSAGGAGSGGRLPKEAKMSMQFEYAPKEAPVGRPGSMDLMAAFQDMGI